MARWLMFLVVALVGCAHTRPPAAPMLPVAPRVAVAPASAPASQLSMPQESAIVAALAAEARANPAPEVEATVRGRRYACIRHPLEELARGAITADVVWHVYVRDLSQPEAKLLDFERR